MYHRISAVLAAAFVALSAAGLATAAVDPERNASTPTAWHWWRSQTAAQLEQLAEQNDERIVSIDVDGLTGRRFTAALVHNAGPYLRNGAWFFDKSRDEVVALTKGKSRRLVDLEPYVRFGQLRFAGVTVPNAGESGKWWWWNYDLTADQVAADINKHEIRLVDLATYRRNGVLRYAYVGIRNAGEDARAWWWYVNVSPAFVQQKAVEHGARLIDIEHPSKGKLTVVMVRNDENVFTRHAYNVSQRWLNRFVQSNGVRITDIERYGDRYWVTTIDNVDAETGRIRALLRSSPYASGYFGAFGKRVGGPTYVGLAHHAAYQPLSVLKLVPHLYVMDLYDQGKADLDDPDFVTWTSPEGKADEITCPGFAGETQANHASLRETLTRGLGESLNRAHEALLNTYDPAAITARMHAPAIGLEHTDLFYGCKHDGLPDWLSNRTTLAEMGELFEGVDLGRFFPHRWAQTRAEFYGLMATWPAEWLRSVVEDEAANQGKSKSVEAFMAAVEIRGKGGGADSSNADGTWTTGRALSYRVTLPHRSSLVRGGILGVSSVGGFFVNDMTSPCLEDQAYKDPDSVDAACLQHVEKMGKTFRVLTAEIQRLAVREALATWPTDPPPSSSTPSPPQPHPERIEVTLELPA